MTLRAALALLLLAAPSHAASPGAPDILPEAEQSDWNAIGRVNIAGLKLSGMCSGTLVAPDTVLTAAHCLFRPNGKLARARDVHFVAGWRNGAYAAHRTAAAVRVDRGFDPGSQPTPEVVRHDIGIVTLADPILPAQVAALPVAELPRFAGDLRLIGYRSDRPHAPSTQSGCAVAVRLPGVIGLDCAVIPGASGGPVLWQSPDGWRVVALVSAGLTGADPIRALAPLAPAALMPAPE